MKNDLSHTNCLKMVHDSRLFVCSISVVCVCGCVNDMNVIWFHYWPYSTSTFGNWIILIHNIMRQNYAMARWEEISSCLSFGLLTPLTDLCLYKIEFTWNLYMYYVFCILALNVWEIIQWLEFVRQLIDWTGNYMGPFSIWKIAICFQFVTMSNLINEVHYNLTDMKLNHFDMNCGIIVI